MGTKMCDYDSSNKNIEYSLAYGIIYLFFRHSLRRGVQFSAIVPNLPLHTVTLRPLLPRLRFGPPKRWFDLLLMACRLHPVRNSKRKV
jgi:hypothetical protein